MLLPPSSRNEATRTPDPYVPNVVRYQLRYIPIEFLKSDAKVDDFSHNGNFFCRKFCKIKKWAYLCTRL